ncbi:uncharacterized protein LOC119606313 [Lucilia sericata]|uniref:uncharacterized protein LOC119606313 n=1 Tax=Lucilia sericata TaxID=13632 RepID=UPI0018A849A5|nr:uncharacterized protein LOC119606313 [Lucilia sericata]
MSNINICLSLLIIYLTLEIVAAKPVKEISYLEKNINFQYENDQWICGDIECPDNTFGCKIRLHSDEEDKKVFHQSFTCFDEDKMPTLGAEDRIEMLKEKEIDVELETYKGAVSVYMTRYSMGGHESAKGVIAVEDLNNLKESAKSNREFVSEI